MARCNMLKCFQQEMRKLCLDCVPTHGIITVYTVSRQDTSRQHHLLFDVRCNMDVKEVPGCVTVNTD